MDQNQLITMTRREAKRCDIIKDLIAKKIDGAEAAKQLDLSVRQTKRLKAAVNRWGVKGVIHGNRGRKGNRRVNEGVISKAFEGRNKEAIGLEQCLLLSVDDAAGKITGAVFEDNEGVEAVFRFWKEYFKTPPKAGQQPASQRPSGKNERHAPKAIGQRNEIERHQYH